MTSSNNMLNFGLFGCGRIGRMHGRNITLNSRARLAACYDVAADAARQAGAALGCTAVASIDDILGDPAIKAVLIASSTDTHVELIRASARAGKAVFCEKPIDLDMALVDACWRDIGSLDPLLMIGFNRRFDPEFRSVKERLDAGAIGSIEQVVITNRDPAPPPPTYLRESGGLLHDFTIHDFDMARYLAGEIVEVSAFGANLVDPMFREADDIDTAMLVLRTAGGALVHINNTRRCVYGYDQRIEVFGAKGMLQAGNRHPSTVEVWTADGTRARDPVMPGFMSRYDDSYRAELDHFIDCVVNGTKPITDFASAREALRIADAAVASMKSGKTMRLEGAGRGS